MGVVDRLVGPQLAVVVRKGGPMGPHGTPRVGLVSCIFFQSSPAGHFHKVPAMQGSAHRYTLGLAPARMTNLCIKSIYIYYRMCRCIEEEEEDHR